MNPDARFAIDLAREVVRAELHASDCQAEAARHRGEAAEYRRIAHDLAVALIGAVGAKHCDGLDVLERWRAKVAPPRYTQEAEPPRSWQSLVDEPVWF